MFTSMKLLNFENKKNLIGVILLEINKNHIIIQFYNIDFFNKPCYILLNQSGNCEGIIMKFQDVIETRKSIRTYCDKEVEESKIEYIFECARLAPSWVNRQCWRFIVVKDKEKIKALSKTSIVNRWIRTVPIIIVACGDPTSSGVNNNIDYFVVDVSIAMEHIILAATDVDLGTCWIAGFDEKKVKELLEIPNRIRVVALTPLGYPAQKNGLSDKTRKLIASSKKRKQLDEIIRYERW